MPNFIAVAPETIGKRRWKRPTAYHFAARTTMVPLLVAELANATMALPLAFAPQGAEFHLAALLGLTPGENLFVAPDGRWLAGYVPAALRGYPFQVGNGPDGQKLLCVDADMLVDEHVQGGEPVFNADGSLADSVKPVLEFLSMELGNVSGTNEACAALQAANLIVPWDITVQSDQGSHKLEGLYKIDEPALNALTDDAFIELRKKGALLVAYCQLLSTHHCNTLGQLAQARQTVQAKSQAIRNATLSGDIDLSSLTSGRG